MASFKAISDYRTFPGPAGSSKMHRLYSAHREIWDHVTHTKYPLWSPQGFDLPVRLIFLLNGQDLYGFCKRNRSSTIGSVISDYVWNTCCVKWPTFECVTPPKSVYCLTGFYDKPKKKLQINTQDVKVWHEVLLIVTQIYSTAYIKWFVWNDVLSAKGQLLNVWNTKKSVWRHHNTTGLTSHWISYHPLQTASIPTE